MGSGGCSGWLIQDPATSVCEGSNFLTAGHCGAPASGGTMQFNVPLSSPTGSINHPGPEDQYSVDPESVQSLNSGVGFDWMYMGCFPNSETGLTAYEAQGDAYELTTAVPSVGACTSANRSRSLPPSLSVPLSLAPSLVGSRCRAAVIFDCAAHFRRARRAQTYRSTATAPPRRVTSTRSRSSSTACPTPTSRAPTPPPPATRSTPPVRLPARAPASALSARAPSTEGVHVPRPAWPAYAIVPPRGVLGWAGLGLGVTGAALRCCCCGLVGCRRRLRLRGRD
eukprot:COSAG01_NODE_2776_length_7094_cov_14.701930_2_plen_282_part_00